MQRATIRLSLSAHRLSQRLHRPLWGTTSSAAISARPQADHLNERAVLAGQCTSPLSANATSDYLSTAIPQQDAQTTHLDTVPPYQLL